MYEVENSSKNKKIVGILGIVIIILGVIFFIFLNNDKKLENENNNENQTENNPEQPVEDVPEKKLQIIDVDSKSRPYAVMINNHPDARSLQSGLQDAYMIYEMNVEYGLTRLMALYKDKTTERIGSVRSSRHTFLDYVLEHDAIYVHFGWSYIAEEQLPKLGINNLNGLYDSFFWRDTTLNTAYEHTAFTSIAKIEANVKSKNYRTTSDKELLLNYTVEENNLTELEPISADSVKLNFSNYTVNTFNYDSNEKVYKRLVNGVEIKDYVTKQPLKVKNIIAIKVKNWTLSGTTLQDFSNIGEGDGYYITNGKAVPIKWYKDTRTSQTVYKYLNGEEIEVNDGNTYIGIVPLGNTITIK